MKTRFATRLVVIATCAIGSVLMLAAPALAGVKPDDGEIKGPSLGLGNTILLFVVLPIGVSLVIAGLAVLPSALTKPRYRPGKPWDHESRWIGGPPGGAEPATDGPTTARGGASAEW